MSAHLYAFGGTEAAFRGELERLRAAGVTWIREDFLWSEVEPSKGTFDWSHTDPIMAASASAQVDVLAILDYSAYWASSGPAGDIFYPPKNFADFAKFAREVVLRYGEGGSFWTARPDLAPRPLRAVEIWNEPWLHIFWKPDPDPAAYAALARAAAVEINEVHPEIDVLVSGDLMQARSDGASPNWFEAVLAADSGLPALVDALSVHPYPAMHSQADPYDESQDLRRAFGRVALIRGIAQAHGVELPLWITEVGWSTASTLDGVSEDTQAAYVRSAVTRAIGEWGAYVPRIFFYSWSRSSPDPTDLVGNYAFLRSDGTAKPVWDALSALVEGG